MRPDDESLSELLLPQRRLPFFRRCSASVFSQKHMNVKLLSGAATGVLLITLLAGVFVLASYRRHRQETVRAHTVEVTRISSAIESDIAALESAYRGFLLNGKVSHLEAFERGRAEIKSKTDALADLVRDRAAQQERATKTQESVQQWLAMVAIPEMNARQAKAISPVPAISGGPGPAPSLGIP